MRRGIFVLLLVVLACCGRAPTGPFTSAKMGLTIQPPDGWTVEESEDGPDQVLELTAPPGGKYGELIPNIYVMRVEQPEGWSFEKDLADMANHFKGFEQVGTGKSETGQWVEFTFDQDGTRVRSLNFIFVRDQHLFTIACLYDDEGFEAYADVFRAAVKSITMGEAK